MSGLVHCPSCGVPATGDLPACRAGWDHLPEDLRRLLAQTYEAMADGDPDGPAMHAAARAQADEYRRDQYHVDMQALQAERRRLRDAS